MIFKIGRYHDPNRLFPRGERTMDFAFDAGVQRLILRRILAFRSDRLGLMCDITQVVLMFPVEIIVQIIVLIVR